MITRYCDVVNYYVHQHPLMFIVLALCVIAIALMWVEANRMNRVYEEPKEKKCPCCQSTDLEHTDNNGDSETIMCLDCGYSWNS